MATPSLDSEMIKKIIAAFVGPIKSTEISIISNHIIEDGYKYINLYTRILQINLTNEAKLITDLAHLKSLSPKEYNAFYENRYFLSKLNEVPDSQSNDLIRTLITIHTLLHQQLEFVIDSISSKLSKSTNQKFQVKYLKYKQKYMNLQHASKN